LRGPLRQRRRHGGQRGGKLGLQRVFHQAGDVTGIRRRRGSVDERGGGGRLDGGAGRRRLDQRHFEVGMPLQVPHLLERAPGTAGTAPGRQVRPPSIGRSAPVHAEDVEAVQ
jgi:hypothetical protein